jgi:hypothetical protein
MEAYSMGFVIMIKERRAAIVALNGPTEKVPKDLDDRASRLYDDICEVLGDLMIELAPTVDQQRH